MPTISALPAAPDPNDRSTFNARAYPWSVALSTMTGEINALLPSIDSAATASAAAIAAANYKGLWSSLTGALAIPASVFHASKVWMLTESVADVTAQVPGVSAKWISFTASAPSLTRSARTSNTILGTADKGKLIDITSGTFSQTFDAVATLGDGWWCYLRNSGTGVVTLDPNDAETIDGVATKALDPLQTVIVQCDGTALRTIPLSGVGNHAVIVHTGNGRGSTNTCIRRFTTALTNVGTAITYADSATLGATFTINEAGLYAIQARDVLVAGGGVGVSVNSTQLTTAIDSINVANRLSFVVAQAADTIGESTVVARLAAGDVVRHHANAFLNNTTDAVSFSIRKVGI